MSSKEFSVYRNDPSAGSPTETLLRLLLPLSAQIHLTFPKVRQIHLNTRSVGATGGVYKEQGRNQHKMLTCAYETFLVRVPQLQETVP